jgi:hypothetical protein
MTMDLFNPAVRMRVWLTVAVIVISAVFSSVSNLPFGTPTFAGVVAFVAAASLAEAFSVYYRRRDDRWAWTAATGVIVVGYALDPGWWMTLGTPVLLISYLARHYTFGQALLRALGRDAATLSGAWVAYMVLSAENAGTGFATMALAGLSGLLARMAINVITHYPLPDQRGLTTVSVRAGMLTELLLAYVALACVWAWQQEGSTALFVVGPMVAVLLTGLFCTDRTVLRMRLFEAVAAGQAESRRSPLDMAWTIGHAIDRFSGPASTVYIAVCGSRAKYYEIVNGVPRLRLRGGQVWDHEWVSLMRRSANPLISRTTDEGHEYLFRLSDGPDNTVLYRILTEQRSSFRYRMPMSTVREFVVAARRWAEPTLRSEGDMFAAVSETSNHLLSLLSQRGNELPVREILVELRRLEELVAASLAGTQDAGIPETRDRASRVPLGAWNRA